MINEITSSQECDKFFFLIRFSSRPQQTEMRRKKEESVNEILRILRIKRTTTGIA